MAYQSKYLANDEDYLHENLIRGEIFSPDKLQQFAEGLGADHVHVITGGRGEPLTNRLLDNDQKLRDSYRSISDTINQSIEMPPAAEWLVDNYFVLEEQIREIRSDLPPGYYRKLPKFAYGALKGYPRIYALALAFVAHTDSFFSPAALEAFITGYQKKQALNICELWAVSIALRIALVENLRRASLLIIGDRRAREEADQFASDLLKVVENDPKAIEKGLKSVAKASLAPSFVVQLIRRLRDQDARVIPYLQLLDARLQKKGQSAESIVHNEHQTQGALTVTVRNIITSMRLISTFDWVEFFEKVSLVDDVLRAESSFGAMDLPTRNLYRRAIERFAQRSNSSEAEVAKRVLALTQQASEGHEPQSDQTILRKRDPGYFLIDKGRQILEAAIQYRTSWSDRLHRQPPVVNFIIYILANVCLVTFIIEAGLAEAVHQRTSLLTLLILSTAAFFPAWESVITLVNRFVFLIRAPSILPGMALREGIPAEFRTMVVMPVLMGGEKEIKNHINHLLIHYLSNPDDDLSFALLSDFKDADTETVPSDAEQLKVARDGIDALNKQYGRDDGRPRFYILHRRRQWNSKQNKWMGWERKRGKLHEFNRLIGGARDTSFILDEGYEKLSLPTAVRFVVTLDADTRLPRGSVKRMVGKMCHPLNRACLDVKQNYVIDGYGILQPRVSSTLPEQNSDTLFQRIFYSASGIDPYAFAISDVYQDLFEEGSFTGKGIYDVEMFERAIAGRIPENAVLSHDLIEGIFARAGLASDVEVVEDFPSRYDVASMRQSRWVRGDWQLLPWIFGRKSREVPALGYWKMIDNLRRTFTAPFTLLALIIGWTLPLNDAAGIWTILILSAYTMPLLLPYCERLFPHRGASRRNHAMAVALDSWQTGQQILCMIMFLPHQAWLMVNAIARTLWRLLISHKNLLEWVTAEETKLRRSRTILSFYRYMSSSVVISLLSAGALFAAHSEKWRLGSPFFVLWLLAPAFAYYSSRPIAHSERAELGESERKEFRLIARQTWRFFERFVTKDENWLPPDNFQEDPAPVVAHRTSPTNVGLYLLATASARDLGWISLSDLLSRFETCFATLNKMEKFRGHLFNWYDTKDLRPLEPRYISAVDSGNFAACCLVIAQICKDIKTRPIIDASWIDGLTDTLLLCKEAIAKLSSPTPSASLRQLESHLSEMNETLKSAKKIGFSLNSVFASLQKLANHAAAVVDLSLIFVAEGDGKGGLSDADFRQWAEELYSGVVGYIDTLDRFAPWMSFIEQNGELREKIPEDALEALTEGMPDIRGIETLCTKVAELINPVERSDRRGAEFFSPANQLISVLQSAIRTTQEYLDKAASLEEQATEIFHTMDFRFLLDPKRKLLSIGFRVSDNELDASFYDLLASEARLASIVAIAKGDIPESNWFRLGRAITAIGHRPVLISWSGSMFEYLMPSLVMREPEDSFIGVTNRLVVRRQISYGAERGVPWGVSESAYNARDLELTYQYTSFGIPGLGLKRGLGENIVVAPYATGLASMVEPNAALENYKVMEASGARGYYGWYEAIDFTSKRLPEGEKQAVVKAYMAHHQGMTLIAIQNLLLNGRMRDRFHSHPLIQATELLLQELPPRNVAVAHPRAEEVDAISHIREIEPTQPRYFQTPHGHTPKTHLLSNGQYAVMLTTAGSGFSHLRDLAVTRWREDATRDNWGSYIYIRDMGNGDVRSATFQPVCVEPQSYEVTFHEDRAEFVTTSDDLITTLNVIVSAEDQGEVRRLSISNRSNEVKEVELTSYAELVMAPPAADVAHPAFVKMFVETEYLSKTGTLLAKRRPRSAEETPIFVAHFISVGSEAIGEFQYETDRARFIGRGNTVRDPVALDGRPLSGTVGTVLDPILSLRCRVKLTPGVTTQVAFWTFVASSREELLNVADKYRSPNAYSRAATIAWTQAQLQYQHLSITPEEAHLFQQLANAVLYADPSLRPNPETIKSGAAAQSVLWSAGVSGDLPIVLMRVDIVSDLKTLRQLVKAHTYWSMKRLEVDLVILNEQPSSYLETLHNEIELMVRTSQSVPRAVTEGVKGKIHILRGDQISPAARNLLHSAARAVIIGHRGSLSEQLAMQTRAEFTVPVKMRSFNLGLPSQAAKRPSLEFFNGIGGFTNGGREYAVILEEGQNTPAPWINVIANPEFGFQVSAEGCGYTWSLNSRENKLTPWSNDPVSNEPGELLYLRDLERGLLWSPTAAPIRKAEATYQARHGFGYTIFETTIHEIETELLQYVPLKDPVKISRLRISNKSYFSRRLSVSSFTEWILGPSPNNSAGLTISEMDWATSALFVRNHWTSNFGERTAFVHMSGKDLRWTSDRTEFIGRNGTLSAPAALMQRKALTGKTGAGLDPCSVLQTRIELKPGEEIEVVVLLGESPSAEGARALIRKYAGKELDDCFAEVKTYWNNLLGRIQVETPDRSLDIILNGWSLYQTMVCRVWARSAFYQSSGAYGYRDQLQDVMTLALTEPSWTRQHLIRAAGRQFAEGDVQHWWLPSQTDAGRGVRTRFSDDALWLAYAAAYYVRVTGDNAVMNEKIPFLLGPVLGPEQHEAFFLPETSIDRASLYEHCARAIDKSLGSGVHGLGLFGGGDWNDGMNRVGIKGQGESVWLTWFLITVIRDFVSFADAKGDPRAAKWRAKSEEFRIAVDTNAWDGEWYRRGYYDDGTPLGSASSGECRIDSIAQSWAVISGAGEPDHQDRAMAAVGKNLVHHDEGLALLFIPPFNQTTMDPGYIKGYPPGIRENGGQYTHASLWTAIAYTLMGEGDKAHSLFSMLNPINHANSRAASYRYKVEPYAIAADVYANPQHVGRGGWTWYTGSAGWMYRTGIEYILGFKLEGDTFHVDPCIPKSWSGFKIIYLHKSARYLIRVENKEGVERGVKAVELDGLKLENKKVPLVDDNAIHNVKIIMGK